jgi:O-antigen/teichoic acid export membrane protein
VPFLDLLKSKFAKDTLILQVGEVVGLGLAFVTSVFIARGLEPAGYGLYALVYSLFGIMTLTGDLGLAPATVTQLAEALARRDRAAAAEYCGYFVKLSLVLGLALTAAWLLAGPAIAQAVYGQGLIGLLAGLLMADMLLGVPRNLVRVAWQAGRSMTALSVFEVLRGLARLAGVGLVLLLGGGVTAVVAVEVVLAGVASAASLPLYAGLHRADPAAFPSWAETLAQARLVPLKKHFAFGFQIVLDRNVVRILEAAPFLFLGRFAPAAEVGYLRLAWGFVNLPLTLLSALANNLAARLPQLRAQGREGEFWATFSRTALVGGALSLGGVGLCALLAPWLVKLLYGADYLPALPYVYVLAIGAAASGFFAGIGAFYRAVHRVGLLVAANSLQLALYLPACGLLTWSFQALGGAAFISGRMILLNGVAMLLALAWVRARETPRP